MLANRLKCLLSKIISEVQSAFIPGRLITDNVIAAFEINHWMHIKKQGKMGYSALKIDMSKAYDRVSWEFIREIMLKMGFARKWVDWILLCMNTVRYSFLISGREVGPIMPKRGLRQGDPISPYLFLLCTEGLTALIQRKQEMGILHGCKIARHAPVVTHLFFADDCYLFFRATSEEAECIKECLSYYAQASGQLVNFHKSCNHFSRNTSNPIASAISQILQVSIEREPSVYLGLPNLVSKNRYEIFRYIKERVWNKMQGWKGKILSRSSKEILIKSVIQSIPSYVMSVFLLPKRLCDEVESLMNKFWWCSNVDNRGGIRWMSWDRLCSPKKIGGMGFRKIRDFNLSFIGKTSLEIDDGTPGFHL